jgi:hypothetical protein
VLVPLDRVYVEANFKETQLGGLSIYVIMSDKEWSTGLLCSIFWVIHAA